MSQQNEAIFRRWIDAVWKNGDEETIDELFDRNGVAVFPHFLQSKPITGVDEYKRFVRFIRRRFSAIDVTIEQIASDDDKVVSYCTFTGAASGESGERMTASGLCQVIIRDGKILQTWSNIDVLLGDDPFVEADG